MAHIVAAAMSQYMLQIRAVDAKKRHLSFILKQLEKPWRRPLKSPQILLHSPPEFLNFQTIPKNATPMIERITTIHQMLKSSLVERGSHIWEMKKPPNFSHLADRSKTSSRSIVSMSQPLSNTTVPRTLSYDAFFLKA